MTRHIKDPDLPKPIRWFLFWTTLIIYWLLLGYMISDIFQRRIIDFSKSKRLCDKLRGNKDGGKTQKLRIFIVVASLVADWLVAGLILSTPMLDAATAEELHLLKQTDAPVTLALLASLFAAVLTIVTTARFKGKNGRPWRYFDVTNMRKILVVLFTTNVLAWISVSLQRPALLYLPVAASLWSAALFFYKVFFIHEPPKPYTNDEINKFDYVELKLETKLREHAEEVQKASRMSEGEPEG